MVEYLNIFMRFIQASLSLYGAGILVHHSAGPLPKACSNVVGIDFKRRPI